jgi:hypothetical protein
MRIITILGSCRQDSIYNSHDVTSVKNEISYPHYTKEILEVIRFCKYGTMTPDETVYTLRSAILANQPIIHNRYIADEFNSSELYFVEIASRKTYKYKNRYVHHILNDHQIRSDVEVGSMSDEEIESDILEIIQELGREKTIIVGHIVTRDSGIRYELLKLLERICTKYNIAFLNPVEQLMKKGHNIQALLLDNAHYNDKGHSLIREIYDDYVRRGTS